MRMRQNMYELLVNRVPGIQKTYHQYRKTKGGRSKIGAWGLLAVLNIRYYILRDHKINDVVLYPDRKVRIIKGSESEATYLGSPKALAGKLSGYDVISFDVFDTLILRTLKKPSDVFYLVQKDFTYMDLKNLRIEAEREARKHRFYNRGDSEVRLKEIWEILSDMTGILASAGMESEFQNEKKVCVANPFFLEVIKLLQESGKKLIVCSDMYLGEKRIRELLLACGYPEFDQYFISGDHRISKSDGKMYRLIKKKNGTEKTYVHVGDNPFSDGVRARKNGFASVLYQNVQEAGEAFRPNDLSVITGSIYSGLVNSHLHNGLQKYSPLYEFGYLYGGLFVTGYCQFIHRFRSEHQIDRLLFLSRDGDILRKAYMKMYPKEADLASYVYWSRLAGTRIGAKLEKNLFFDRMIRHKINQNYTLRSVFDTMELDFLLDTFLSEKGNKITEQTILNAFLAGELIDFLNRNWEKVLSFYEPEGTEAKKYFEDCISDAQRIAIIDIGWVGSGAIILKKLMETEWKIASKVYGLVAGTLSGNCPDPDLTAIETADGTIHSYLFSESMNRDIWKLHDPAKGHNLILELLVSSDQHSFRSFRSCENGAYTFSASKEKIDAGEIQRGILDFVSQYQSHPLGDLIISGRDAFAPIQLLYQNPEYLRHMLSVSKIPANVD